MFLKQRNMINGAGAYLYIGDRSDKKFAQKNFKEKLNTDIEFRTIFNEVVLQELITLLSETDNTAISGDSCSDDILEQIYQNAA